MSRSVTPSSTTVVPAGLATVNRTLNVAGADPTCLRTTPGSPHRTDPPVTVQVRSYRAITASAGRNPTVHLHHTTPHPGVSRLVPKVPARGADESWMCGPGPLAVLRRGVGRDQTIDEGGDGAGSRQPQVRLQGVLGLGALRLDGLLRLRLVSAVCVLSGRCRPGDDSLDDRIRGVLRDA